MAQMEKDAGTIQLLEVSPQEKLYFTAPFTEISKTHISLKNLTFKDVMYKVKTTEPKKYCVRPNMGVISPQQTITITVILQPSDDSIYNFQGLHKFQIQHKIKDEIDSKRPIEELWKMANPNLIFQHKLKVFFETREAGDLRQKDEILEKELLQNQANSQAVKDLIAQLERLKKDNIKLSSELQETQKRLEVAQKPAQFPDLLMYIVIGILGWLISKFII